MSISQQINNLIQQLSGNAIPENLAGQTLTALQPVKITGAVIAYDEANVVLEVGEIQLEIPTHQIMAIQENPSTPATTDESIYVDLQVAPTTKIVERRLRTAAQYGSWLGKRPFVYELPSQTAEFSVSDAEFHAQQDEWLEQVGLTGFHSTQMARQTSNQTSSNTSSNTSSQTSHNTTTTTSSPQGFKTDNQMDHKTDSRPDFRTDWKTDFRFDP